MLRERIELNATNGEKAREGDTFGGGLVPGRDDFGVDERFICLDSESNGRYVSVATSVQVRMKSFENRISALYVKILDELKRTISMFSTLGGAGVTLDGLTTSSTVADLHQRIQQKTFISPADQKSMFAIS